MCDKQYYADGNPGSYAAKKLGCICPVLDNYHGKGFGGCFWITENCPIHANKETNKNKELEDETL